MGRVIHFEIPADEMDRAERFYRDVFGWQIAGWGGPIDYRLATTGPDDAAGINGALMPRGENDGAGGRGGGGGVVITVAVDDIARTEAAIGSAGGRLDGPRSEVPGIGWIRYFVDPEGNRLCALQPTDRADGPATSRVGGAANIHG